MSAASSTSAGPRGSAGDAAREDVADVRPIALGDGDRAVLLLHGLTGTPWEVRPLASALAEAGFAVRAPLLAGHESVEALEGTTWRDWYGSAEAALRELLRGRPERRVLVLGFSMGGLLALRLAAHRPRDVCALVTIGVPLELPVVQRRLAQGLAHLRRQPWIGRAVGRFPKGDPDLRSARAREESPSLREFPYPCLASLVDLQAEVVALLPSVRAPLLVLHAQHDHTAPVAHSERLAQLVGSPRVRRVVLPHSFHVVGRDLDRARACAEVTAFAREVLPAAAPSATP